jgi:hypothetical protein
VVGNVALELLAHERAARGRTRTPRRRPHRLASPESDRRRHGDHERLKPTPAALLEAVRTGASEAASLSLSGVWSSDTYLTRDGLLGNGSAYLRRSKPTWFGGREGTRSRHAPPISSREHDNWRFIRVSTESAEVGGFGLNKPGTTPGRPIGRCGGASRVTRPKHRLRAVDTRVAPRLWPQWTCSTSPSAVGRVRSTAVGLSHVHRTRHSAESGSEGVSAGQTACEVGGRYWV